MIVKIHVILQGNLPKKKKIKTQLLVWEYQLLQLFWEEDIHQL